MGATQSRVPVLELARRARVVHAVEPGGSLEVYLPRQDVAVTFVEGRLTAPMAERWIETLDRQFSRGARFQTFHDWDLMTSYDSAARQALTSWVVSSIRHILSADFLATHGMVRMGVAAAGVATALAGLRVEVHSTRQPFLRAIEQCLAPPP
ncbi:MAG: hypothetical protein IT377_18755 [Polyangiaceae bacterium]|nr:hypothetical protein [Myxococcales bacterium]MCC6901026.1 hypothetical protein [Polyangiaceae bacterium]